MFQILVFKPKYYYYYYYTLSINICFSVEARCAFPNFDCDNPHRNPCTLPRCDPAILHYTGAGPRQYVLCNASGGCQEGTCDEKEVFSQAQQICVKA